MANPTEERLWNWAARFGRHFTANSCAELLEVKPSLQNPEVEANRWRALVFSMYQLVINGAIAEHNVRDYQASLPGFVKARLGNEHLSQAAMEAWQGTAYTPPRPNLLGSILFMVVLLFFFESACRMKLDKDDLPLSQLVRELRNRSLIGDETCNALSYLAELSNVWHNFGLHNVKKPKWFYESTTDTSLHFPDLDPGNSVEPLGEAEQIHLLDEVLGTFCTLMGVAP